jgi:hypothetical protein
MANVSFSVTDNITASTKRIQAALDKLPVQAHAVFVKETPIRTGNARRSTKLVKNEIQANYPYASRLDEGYSRQSPKGMSDPTEKFVQTKVAQILRKK